MLINLIFAILGFLAGSIGTRKENNTIDCALVIGFALVGVYAAFALSHVLFRSFCGDI